MRSRIWLILWITGILFPMAFLGRVWPAFGKWFDPFFASGLTHIIFHSFLYAVLAILIGQWISPVSWNAWLKILGLILLIGSLHEGIQVTFAGLWPGWTAELLDLSVDFCGAVLGLTLKTIYSLRLMKKPS